MVKVNVEIPNDLYLKSLALAEQQKCTLAEIICLGLDFMTSYSGTLQSRDPWELPLLRGGKPVNMVDVDSAISDERQILPVLES